MTVNVCLKLKIIRSQDKRGTVAREVGYSAWLAVFVSSNS